MIELVWEQFRAPLFEREVADRPLSCYRTRVLDRVVFEKLFGFWCFNCA
jgi:hypothetical protein